MPRILRRPPVLITALVVLIVAGAALAWWWFAPRTPHFETLQECRACAEGQGLRVYGARGHNGIFIADHDVDPLDLPVRKDQAGGGPQWKGIIWVGQLEVERRGQLLPDSVIGNVRQRGNLLVCGDPELLDRIERGW